MDFNKNYNFEKMSLEELKALASIGQYVIGQSSTQGENWEKIGLTKKFADHAISIYDFYLLKKEQNFQNLNKTHANAWVFLFGSSWRQAG